MVVKCIKALHKNEDGEFTTPAQGAPVPENGIMIPRQKKIQWHTSAYDWPSRCNKARAGSVEGGVIHWYQKNQSNREVGGRERAGWRYRAGGCLRWVTRDNRYYAAYAFAVKAYGDTDAVSTFLYVPAADTTSDKSGRIKLANEWAKRDSTDPVTWYEINNSVFGKEYRTNNEPTRRSW